MQQLINNTPTGSGLGDKLYIAFGKVNDNFTELYDSVDSISGSLTKTKTSEFINDGADGLNPFISSSQIPVSWSMNSITGLTSSLNYLYTASLSNSASISSSNSDIMKLEANLNIISNQLVSMSIQISNQNQLISDLQNQISDL
jgi:hypothetical protein